MSWTTTLNDALVRALKEERQQQEGDHGLKPFMSGPWPSSLTNGMEIGVTGMDDLLESPIPNTQLLELKRHAKPSSYGKGSETLVDAKVRQSLQIDAKELHIHPYCIGAFARHVGGLLTKSQFMVPPEVPGRTHYLDLRPYKLLIYGPGGHFVKHRDSEKEQGMVGTVALMLPTENGYTGGELSFTVISSAGEASGEAKEAKQSNKKKSKIAKPVPKTSGSPISVICPPEHLWCAWYADTEHEIKPIKRGYRVTLIFNMFWCSYLTHGPASSSSLSSSSSSSSSSPVSSSAEAVASSSLTQQLSAWIKESSSGCPSSSSSSPNQVSSHAKPPYVAILLSHLYTELSTSSAEPSAIFKGEDATLFRLLCMALDQTGHRVVVLYALMTRRISVLLHADDYGIDDEDEGNIEDEFEFITSLKVVTDQPRLVYWSGLNSDTEKNAISASMPKPFTAKHPVLDRLLEQSSLCLCPDKEQRAPLLMLSQTWSSIGADEEKDKYTGNEGVKRIQQYKRAILLVVPESKLEEMAKKTIYVVSEQNKKRRV